MKEIVGCSILYREGNIVGTSREKKKRPRRQRGSGRRKLYSRHNSPQLGTYFAHECLKNNQIVYSLKHKIKP